MINDKTSSFKNLSEKDRPDPLNKSNRQIIAANIQKYIPAHFQGNFSKKYVGLCLNKPSQFLIPNITSI